MLLTLAFANTSETRYRDAFKSGEADSKTPVVRNLGNETMATAWVRGIWNATGPALPPTATMIPNCEAGELCEDGSGRSEIPGYNSVMMEYFGASADYVDNVARVAAANTLSEVNAYIKVYAGNNFLLPNLVAFLAGAGNGTTFGAIGRYV